MMDDGQIDPSGAEPADNDGNWRSLIRLTLRHGDEALANHLRNGKRNAMYTSKTVQNELLQSASHLVKEKIINAVQKAGFFSLLADETQDRGKRELLQITVRYVEELECSKWVIKEDPLCLINLLSDISQSVLQHQHVPYLQMRLNMTLL